LSDYVNSQTYNNAIQNKIQSTLDEITTLQEELKVQKAQVEQLLADQHQQETTLGAAESQQQSMLAMNQSQQDAYSAQIKANNDKIAALQAERAAANARLIGSGSVTILSSESCGGGYPGSASGPFGVWGCNYGLDSGIDNWGMYNRECVSYTAWRVYERYGANAMPYWGGIGNADQWPGDARAYGIPTGATPRVDSVAIGTNRYWFGSIGHAMWVEAVSGNKILVSQMNFGGPGQYSEMWIDSSLIDTFIYFH
jgi:peptidoglycan DL-endopeptidase CwlO